MRIVIVALMFAGALSGQQREREQLQQKAKAIFNVEMAREKAGDCPNAVTTLAMNDCFGKETETSDDNYKAYASALRTMLVLNRSNDKSALAPGPTGMPLTQEQILQNFDQTEAAWARYSQVMCEGSGGLYKSGTIYHISISTCQIMLVRSHMRELERTYGEYLSR